eukprot:evm.model.scf_661.1 EVM.evm.TU.scf_661.1   scf_661:590-1999(+)
MLALAVLWLAGSLALSSAARVRTGLELDCTPAVQAPPDFLFFPSQFQAQSPEVLVDGLTVEVQFADDFSVEYRPNFKVVRNLRADETYVLYQCGTAAPDVEEELGAGAKLFEVPLSSVSVFDTTVIEFLQILGVADRVNFTSEFSTDPCFQRIQGECGWVAADPAGETAGEQEPFVDAIFYFSATPSNKTVAFSATADPSPLKRAEWVKFLSLFFNKEVEANSFFDLVRSTWDSLRVDDTPEDAPVVAWVDRREFPSDAFFIHFAPFKVAYVEAAGGRTLDRSLLSGLPGVDETADGFSIPIDNLTAASSILLPVLETADVVIDETFEPINADYDLAAFLAKFGIQPGSEGRFPFLEGKKLFRLDGTVSPGLTEGLDWFETAVARPDLAIGEFLAAFGSPGAPEGQERFWLRNVAEGVLPKAAAPEDCPDDVFWGCQAAPEPICPSVVATCDGGLALRLVDAPCLPPVC